ncbi:hypothetical protein GJAV_G00092750 [Gymnothorax javanicus]|nr:hypothetical protein GJAV_G00092750 [Gymnothorax javanicus]
MRTTLICLWLLNSLVHMISAGCSLYAPKHVTGYTGDSVVLPCYCTDGQAIRRTSVRWISFTVSPSIHIWTFPDEVDYRYRDRVVISEDTGNFSLHLSNLTQRDDGEYRCEADGQFRDITLTVKDPGCVLSEAGPKTITGFRGGSIILPCVCTDVQSKPEQVKWTADPVLLNTVIFPECNAPPNSPYRNRVQLLNSISPGNLSLRTSNLTLTDGGTYRCEVDSQYRDITLTIKDDQYITTVKDPCCVLSNSGPSTIIGYTGLSVLLPCACSNLQEKPEHVKWTADLGEQSTVLFPEHSTNDQEMTESTGVRQVYSTRTSLSQLKVHAVFFLILNPTPSLATPDSQFSYPVPVLISRRNLNMSNGLQILESRAQSYFQNILPTISINKECSC